MYENQTEFELQLLAFGKRVEYILAAEMAGRMNANDAYKEIKFLFENVKKFRKSEKKQDHPLDYDQIPDRY